MSTTPYLKNYSALIATLHGMSYEQALTWVSKPELGFTAEQQRMLLDGRERARCTTCSWGPR